MGGSVGVRGWVSWGGWGLALTLAGHQFPPQGKRKARSPPPLTPTMVIVVPPPTPFY
jgi:hypothetical protein